MIVSFAAILTTGHYVIHAINPWTNIDDLTFTLTKKIMLYKASNSYL